MSKIKLFKDQGDFIITLTDDKLMNIIGTKGSGKTTASLKYIDNDRYIVINCDRLFELPSFEKEDKELNNVRNILKKKYGELKENKFKEYYIDIVDYIKHKKKVGLIEGNVVQDLPIEELKGRVLIKRTGKLKSFYRSVKRDYRNRYWMNEEKKKHIILYPITRFFKILKRRSKIFKQAKDIDNIIYKLENRG